MLAATLLTLIALQEPNQPPAAPPALTDPAEVLRLSADALSKLHGLSGKFQLSTPGEKTPKNGAFRLAKPNLWEVTGVPIEVRNDGTSVWHYDAEAKIYEKKAPKLGELAYLVGFEGFFGAPPERKALTLETATLFRDEVYSVVIESAEGYKSTKLFIDKTTLLPRGWSMTDASGLQASVKVSELQKDPELKPESFAWKPPAGARILEQVELENRLVGVGEAIPPVMFARLDGSPFRVVDYLARARVSLMVFWNTDCDACKAALTEMPSWSAGYAATDVQMLAVNVGDGPQAAQQALREKSWRGAVALTDSQAPATQVLRIMAYPTLYMVGRDGVVKGRFVGWDRTRVEAVLTQMGIKRG